MSRGFLPKPCRLSLSKGSRVAGVALSAIGEGYVRRLQCCGKPNTVRYGRPRDEYHTFPPVRPYSDCPMVSKVSLWWLAQLSSTLICHAKLPSRAEQLYSITNTNGPTATNRW